MSMRARSRTFTFRLVCALLAAGVLAGCDKCGNRVKFNAPSLPDSCGENAPHADARQKGEITG